MNTSSSISAITPQPQPVTTSNRRYDRRLLDRAEVISALSLTEEKVQQLINTRQILALRIAGEERFDSWDISGLIDSYKKAALQRTTA